jgi:circadian clock protein KaiB
MAQSHAQPDEPRYELQLFLTGTTPRSLRALQNIRRVCETYLEHRYSLKVVDIYQQPAVARCEQLVVAPTLVKRSPPPVRRLVGDMRDLAKVLRGLDLAPAT